MPSELLGFAVFQFLPPMNIIAVELVAVNINNVISIFTVFSIGLIAKEYSACIIPEVYGYLFKFRYFQSVG